MGHHCSNLYRTFEGPLKNHIGTIIRLKNYQKFIEGLQREYLGTIKGLLNHYLRTIVGLMKDFFKTI